jgi:hypothetical protein
MEIRNTSVTEEYELQRKQQCKRGLCTMAQFDDATKTWLWCQNSQHTRGKKKKCLRCLSASDDLNERLVAQGFCNCKLDHPAGRGCPDRFLREGLVHLISKEQVDWYKMQLLTNDGKINIYSDEPDTPAEEAYMRHFLNTYYDLISTPPPSLAKLNRAIRQLRPTRGMTRRQRNLRIVVAAEFYRMWNDPELDLKKKARLAHSQMIKDGMEAARFVGRNPGRPRITKTEG